MSHWISSKTFAQANNINNQTIYKAVQRAIKADKKFCSLIGKKFPIKHINGIGGNAGKVLQIWNIPLSEKQVEALEKGYLVEYVLEEMGNESKAVENPQCVGFRNDLNGGVAKSLVCKNMDCHTLLRSVCNDAVEEIAVEHNVNMEDANASKDCSVYAKPTNPNANNPHSPKEMQSNVMESRDFKALDCEENKMAEKGIDNEKTSQNIQGKTLYARGCNNANECASRTTSSSDSTLYRNDLSACEITQSQLCVQEKSKVSFVGLNAKQQQAAKQKLEVIEAYKQAKVNGVKCFTFLAQINLKYPHLNLKESKLFDWLRKYKKGGISALADLRGVNRVGETCIPKHTQEKILELWRAYGNGHCNFSALWRKFHQLNLSRKQYTAFLKEEIPPLVSLSTFNRFLNTHISKNTLEASLVMQGEDKTESKFSPAFGVQRALVKEPNALWQIDSSILDCMVLDTDGKQMRPSIVSAVDVYSGRGVMYLCQNSDSNAILRLLWKAFREMGKPQAIKCDNGKDYLSGKVQDLLSGLGIIMLRSYPYSGKEKAMVERRFGVIQGDIFSSLSGGLGRNVSERENIEQRTPKRSRGGKDKAGNAIKTNQKNLHSYETIAAFLEEAVEHWNLDKVSRKGKQSPMELWNCANFKRVNVGYAEFLLYAGEGEIRSVTKSGIAYKNNLYIPINPIEVGCKVNVRVSLDDNSRLFVFNSNGEFISEARNKEVAPLSGEELKKIKSFYKSKLNTLRKAIKQAENNLYAQEVLRAEEVRLAQEYKQAISVGLNTGSLITKKALEVGVKAINKEKSDFNWDNVGVEFFKEA